VYGKELCVDGVEELYGQRFREAWIRGVQKHFPGTPKPGYISPWEEMPSWEQKAASAVYSKVRELIRVGLQHEPPTRLVDEQGGRYISESWNVQVYRHIENPKPGYVADWESLPEWQRLTDMEIFVDIEKAVLEEFVQV
jgi:hypothetical protein